MIAHSRQLWLHALQGNIKVGMVGHGARGVSQIQINEKDIENGLRGYGDRKKQADVIGKAFGAIGRIVKNASIGGRIRKRNYSYSGSIGIEELNPLR